MPSGDVSGVIYRDGKSRLQFAITAGGAFACWENWPQTAQSKQWRRDVICKLSHGTRDGTIRECGPCHQPSLTASNLASVLPACKPSRPTLFNARRSESAGPTIFHGSRHSRRFGPRGDSADASCIKPNYLPRELSFT